ncbi:MAG: hypothetical protein OXI79_20360 [Gammaproteobacteria bacterium]|nr:hypothetical protein [Gammaproteobacteria bacterium]
MGAFRTRGDGGGEGGSFSPSKANLFAAVKAIFHPASNPGVAADDENSELDVASSPGGGLTAEQVRDTVASFLRNGADIAVTHDDAADTLTIAFTGDIPPAFDSGELLDRIAANEGRLDGYGFIESWANVADAAVGRYLVTAESTSRDYGDHSWGTSSGGSSSSGTNVAVYVALADAETSGQYRAVVGNERRGVNSAFWTDDTDSWSNVPAGFSIYKVADEDASFGLQRRTWRSGLLNYRGQWAVGTKFRQNDVVNDVNTPTAYYVARADHTATASNIPSGNGNAQWRRISGAFSFTQLTGTLADNQIPAGIARDSELPSAALLGRIPTDPPASGTYEWESVDGVPGWRLQQAAPGSGSNNRYLGWHDTATGIVASDITAEIAQTTNTLDIREESTDGWLWFWVPDSLGTVQEAYFDGNNHDQLGAFSDAVALAVGGVDGMLYVIANEQNPDILGTGTRTLRLVYGAS